jgi:UDP-N-acetylmuramate--alanine ligase
MSAIARVLLETGYTITGSDLKLNPLSEALRRDGAEIYEGHDAGNVVGAELVLASSAIPADNPELKSAHSLNIPVLNRREAISLLTSGHQTIAVAGTHGKTTTTALLVHTLRVGGIDPTYIVGGVMNNTSTNAGVGQSDIFVIEADEYGEMFLGLKPQTAVLTNIEYDHPDVFADMKALVGLFRQFLQGLSPAGTLVAGVDNPIVASFANNRTIQALPVSTYAIHNPQAEWKASNIEPYKDGMRFIVQHNNSLLGQVYLNLMGEYNVQNALAVIAVARSFGVSFNNITQALASFTGTERRAEVMGRLGGVTVVSDYAHHPTAIQAVLHAWKMRNDNGRIWAVWQPHTYQRMRALSDEFANAFGEADEVLVTSVYSVREKPSEGLEPLDMARAISEKTGVRSRFSGTNQLTCKLLVKEIRSGDVVIILSAGDGPEIGQKLLEHLAGK